VDEPTSSTLIANAIVVTMNDEHQVFFDGAVLVEGDRIASVGTADEVRAKAPDGASTIDAGGGVVMPGLVDLHYHTAIGRGWSDHLPLAEALFDFWYPIVRAIDPEAVYWAALVSYAESIRCGVTTVNDMYRHIDALAKAADEIGIRAVLSSIVADDEHRLDTLEENAAGHRSSHGAGGGRVEVYVGIEWLPLSSLGLLNDASALARDLDTGIHIHLNESIGEVENAKERFGRRPTEVAYEAGILGPRCVAAHCVWLSDTEIGLMRDTGTHISHNPTSNAKLGNGVARVLDYLRAGINVGLGHDSTEGTNTSDLFEVMKFASLTQRATHMDADLLRASALLPMATRNGGAALGHQTGVLGEGRKADLIVLDLDDPGFTPLIRGNRNQVYSHLAFAAHGRAVRTVLIDGNVVMRDRELVRIDEPEVLRQANDAFVRVLESAGIENVQTEVSSLDDRPSGAV
jgi:5-methylthioadenosine/S-adenosylhomocysteine deaminase